jgi:hypothetical protein
MRRDAQPSRVRGSPGASTGCWWQGAPGNGALETLRCSVAFEEEAVAHRPGGEGAVSGHNLGAENGAVFACLLGVHDDLAVEGWADPGAVDGQQREVDVGEAPGHFVEARVSAPEKIVLSAPSMTKVMSGMPCWAGAAVTRRPPTVICSQGSASVALVNPGLLGLVLHAALDDERHGFVGAGGEGAKLATNRRAEAVARARDLGLLARYAHPVPP